MQTKEGGIKLAKTIRDKYGNNYWVEIGRKGGQIGRTGGFASEKVGADGMTGKERARVAGAKGGSISKRSPAKLTEVEKQIISRKADNRVKRIMSKYFTY